MPEGKSPEIPEESAGRIEERGLPARAVGGLLGKTESFFLRTLSWELKKALNRPPGPRKEKKLKSLIHNAEKKIRRFPRLDYWLYNEIAVCYRELREPRKALVNMQESLMRHPNPTDSTFPDYVNDYEIIVARLLEKAIPLVDGKRKVESVSDLEFAAKSTREILDKYPGLEWVRVANLAAAGWLIPTKGIIPIDPSRLSRN